MLARLRCVLGAFKVANRKCEEILYFHLKNEFSKMFLYDLFSNIPLVKATSKFRKDNFGGT